MSVVASCGIDDRTHRSSRWSQAPLLSPLRDVTFTIPERSLGKADLEFKVKRNGEMVGRLKVSNGTVVWVPKNARYGYKLG